MLFYLQKETAMEKQIKFAELLVKVGVNIQKGQTLVLACPIECADFGHIVQKVAYEAGAREVVTRWIDEKGSRISFDLADDAIFDEVPQWLISFFNDYADKDAAFLSISASDPELMKGVDPKRIARSSKARSKALEHYRTRQMSNKNAWCVGSVPTPAWAAKVFPDKSPADAEKLLWDAIYKAVRVDQADPVQAWRKHQEALNKRLAVLNKSQFSSLRYRNSLGTNLRIDLPKNHIWFGGGDALPNGSVFVANMPTEEIFTMPHREGANGRIVSSMPLNYQGNLIEKFWFEFKNGLVVDYGAEQGKENLTELLNTDDGAKRLGEIALVPHDSPISNMGILFYNTLFDENASCHFALGKAYPTCVQDGPQMDKGQLIKAGANDSFTHVDFMIGTADLEVDGINAQGEASPIFRKGNFVF